MLDSCLTCVFTKSVGRLHAVIALYHLGYLETLFQPGVDCKCSLSLPDDIVSSHNP